MEGCELGGWIGRSGHRKRDECILSRKSQSLKNQSYCCGMMGVLSWR